MPKILMAEDSRTQAAQIKKMLEDEAFEVAVARNGAEALGMMGEVHPDLVLTDMEMPEMNGLELVNAVCLQYADVPVVLMTSMGNDRLAVEALERGAAAYVPKATIELSLLRTIQQVLGLMRADRSYAQLSECLAYNEFRFVLRNNPELIEPLVDMMQQKTVDMRLCDPIGRVRVGMALEHALTNAMFRGNLEISWEQSQKEYDLQTEGVAQSLIEQRLSEAPYRDRKIYVHAELSNDAAKFVIRDEGPGFDTSMLPERGDPHLLEREGGRGLVLIRSFMDEVRFNELGNEVTLIKRRETVSKP